MKKIAEKALDIILKKAPCFQDYVNNRYNRAGYIPVDTSILEGAIVQYKGNKYYYTDRINSLKWCESDYDFSDITKNDVVLDIGAEIGGLSIPISSKCKHVYAVEIDPEMRFLLNKNIKLNGIKNITVLDVGLKGNEEMHAFDTPLRSLGKVIKYIEPVTEQPNVIKLDCEGAEWSITPEELKGIRRIEGEVHNLKGFGISSGKANKRFSDFLNMLNRAGFSVKHTQYNDMIMLIHADRKNNNDKKE